MALFIIGLNAPVHQQQIVSSFRPPLLTTAAAMLISRHLHADVVNALHNIADVAHAVRTNRNFSRRVPDERIEEFHHFAQDFNSLLEEMDQWQTTQQAKNDPLLRTAMHDPLNGLPNQAP